MRSSAGTPDNGDKIKMDVITVPFDHKIRSRVHKSECGSGSPRVHHNMVQVQTKQDIRRGSFIYKPELKPENFSSKSSFSRTASVSSTDLPSKVDDCSFVTPFAKILTNLYAVRANLVKILELSNSSSTSTDKDQKSNNDALEEIYEVTSDTMAEFDKCLEEVETIPIQQSISSMTSVKFKKLLDRELNHFSESKSGDQVSRYIAHTFTETDETSDDAAYLPRSESSCGSNFAAAGKDEFGGSSQALTPPSTTASGAPSGSATQLSTPNSTAVTTPTTAPAVATASSSTADAHVIPSSFGMPVKKSSLSSKLAKLYSFKKQPGHNLRKKISLARFSSGLSHGTGAGGMFASVSAPSSARGQQSTSLQNYGVQCDKARELTECMQDIDSWGLDVFTLSTLTKGRPLTAVLYSILKQRNLISNLELDEQVLLKYCGHLEHNYNNANPYHNVNHGADVAQSMHILLNTKVITDLFGELETFSALFAAAIHDVNHPGVTNQFLINTASDLAIMYNDESVLEHHHLAIAFKLLQHPNCNFLAKFSKKQFATFRRAVIDMVLATDMAKHMSLLGYLKTVVETKRVTNDEFLPTFDSHKEKLELLKCMIHLADLSNPTKPLTLYKQWTERISEEFWRQGDQEKKMGLQISPLCDRKTASIEKSQVGFIDYVALPIWESWAELVYPGAQSILDHLEFNRQWYFDRIPQEERSGAENSKTTMSIPPSTPTTPSSVLKAANNSKSNNKPV